MSTTFDTWVCALLLTSVSVAAAAQDVPPARAPVDSKAQPSSAQLDAGEPRANTSPGEVPANADAARPATKAAPTARAAKVSGKKPPGANDRVDLSTATVTGDHEQPKVMYIVPWKKADMGDLSGKPMNSLLDEALAPVDRDEFKREVAYYDALRGDAPQDGAPSPAAKQGEK